MALESVTSEVLQQHTSSPRDKSEGPTVYVGRPADDADIDGLELSAAARILGISIDDIWRQVRNGKLIARTERGQVLVYTDSASIASVDGLPPLPKQKSIEQVAHDAQVAGDVTVEHHHVATNRDNYYPTPLGQTTPSDRQEIALLIDHLSLAKEENREILRLTNESMSRLSELTDKMIEMKDSIIESKDEQMQILKQRLTEQTQELRQALKAKEDLETLTQALQRK
jgi:hypothetical protein